MHKLAEIANAVKPRDRTDKYLILAALYCLNAHTVPVTTRQVTTLLESQFGKKAVPDNVTASLTKYSAYVDPADVGPPRKWQLAQQGLAHLRALSGMSLAAPSNHSPLFYIDEPGLALVTRSLAAVAIDYLQAAKN